LLARLVHAATQLRVEQRRIGAEAPRGEFAGKARRGLRLGVRDQPFFHR
jgi:hypothetical protein